MKRILFVTALMIVGFVAIAQTKAEKVLIERTYLLSHTIFGSKDSSALEGLFAKKLSYGHSGGKVENRGEAVSAISRNKSIYTDTAVSNIMVETSGNIAIVRHLFKAKENKVDGTVTPLNFTMMLVWVKEKGAWRLMGRQAVKLT